MKVTNETFPKEWDPLLLSELVEKAEITLDRGEVISSIMMATNPGNYPVYSSSAKNNGLMGYWGEYQIDEELITWSVDGGGYLFYRPKHKFSVTNVCGMLRANKDKFNIRYLHYLLEWQHSLMTFDYVDKAHPSVIRKRYLIPTIGKSEQDSIATILSTLDRAIASTEKLIAKYQRIKTGLLHDMLTRGIDEQGNLRSEKTHQFKDSKLGRIPVEWEEVCIGELGSWSGGSTPRKSKKEFWDDGNHLWISPKDLVSDIIDDSEDKLTDEAIKSTNRKIIPAGNFIIVFRSGILRHTFPVVICEKDFCINQDLKTLIPFEKYLNRYIVQILMHLSTYFLRFCVKSGTTVESVDGKVFYETKLGMPDKDEQKRILNILNSQDKTASNLKLELLKLRSLKTGLMQDLLSGKVRVK